MTLSRHLTQDRADRYAFIATTIGVGTVVHTYRQAYNKIEGFPPCTVEITSTGVAMVRGDDGTLVTMYILSIQEARKYFVNAAIPMVLNAIIKSNNRRRLHILQDEVHY
jgi:hypothetical protein